MSLERVLRNVEEVLTKDELASLLRKGGKGYIGFEPSGLIHIGWLIWARKLQDLLESGLDMIALAATWHAWINDKLGGDIRVIEAAARYTRHFLEGAGVDVRKVKFVNAEELISDSDYWKLVLRVAKSLSLARVKRAITIMGRRESEVALDFSKLIYPCMQVADILYLDLDLALGGMDQRKAHVLAREVAPKLGFKKPVAIHTPLLMGLQGPRKRGASSSEEEAIGAKMSKSKPHSCIFVHDPPDAIREKIRKAYCPPKEIEGNPVIEINRLLLFSKPSFTLFVDRPEKYGGPLVIESYEELVSMYVKGELHPLDLKRATAEALIEELRSIRQHFTSSAEARDLLRRVADAMGIKIRLDQEKE